MYIIRKKFKFEMAHQLMTSYSKVCKDCIHGHSYILELFFASSSLDSNGMVVDFGEIKDIVGTYINSWDHALVMTEGMDKSYLAELEMHNKKIKIVDYNSTAENMACDIYWAVARLIQPLIEKTERKFQLWKVILHETDTGYAEYQPMQYEEKNWKDVLLDSSSFRTRLSV